MELVPLRHRGKLVKPYGEPTADESEPPRALKSLARIVDQGLCHRCGSCIGICPTDVLGVDAEEYPVVENLNACTDCDLCVRVCPGDEFDAPAISQEMFSQPEPLEDMHGNFEQAYLAFSTDDDIRSRSTSGGLVSQLLIDLLESQTIDGAVVIASDTEELWKGKPMIARSKSEILAATKSKYAISPTNVMLQEIRKTPGKYALVGLPCQIHGFHKAAKIDKRIADRVVLTIGLFCHAAVEHEPMRLIWKNLPQAQQQSAAKFISRVGKHPGTPHTMSSNGEHTPVYFPERKGYRPSSMEILNVLYRLYTPERCLTCYDSTSEFADIAVGDPWMPPPDDSIDLFDGYSFTLARTPRGMQFLHEARTRGNVDWVQLSRAQAKRSNTMMGHEKRWRAFRIIETRKRQGKPIPVYGFEIPKASGKHFVLTEFNMLSHFFCFVSWGKQTVLRFIFSPPGYALLWLNSKKREFRNWRVTTWAKFRRRVGG